MAKDRIIFLMSLAFLGILVAFMFSNSSEESVSEIKSENTSQKSNIDSKVAQVMVAKKKINIGDQLAPELYGWENVEVKEQDPSLLIRDPKVEKWINEAVVIREIAKGEKLKRLDIIWPQESDSLKGPIVLPAKYGKRAIPFKIEEKSSIIQFLKTGMFVDVIFSSDTDKDIGFGTVSLTLLKNIKILSLGNKGIGNKKLSKGKQNKILFEMTPRQAELFSYALEAGSVTLGLIQKGASSLNEKNELVEMLTNSKSAANFKSILATYIIRSHFPNVDINVSSTSKGFIISGSIHEQQVAAKIKEIFVKMSENGEQDVVDLMVVKPQQVLICVKVLEVDRDVKLRLGINWESIFERSGESLALAAVFPRPMKSDPNYFFEAKDIKAGNFTLSAIVDMLQEDGYARIIAEPNLTTISGKTAHFFAGGEFPILIPQGGQLIGTVTVEYKKFGVILEFTPTVDLNGLITIHVVPEISTIDKQNSVTLSGFDIPALVTRRADTTVKLWPGQCYAIAGLLQYERVSKITSLYGLNRLPIIGPLFRSKNFKDRRTELMIILTPYLIYADEKDPTYKKEANHIHG